MPRQNKLAKYEPQNALATIHSQYDAGKFNLLLPKVHVGRLPEGTDIVIREVAVDPAETSGEVYRVDGGKVALTKTTLDRIAAAAGITWESIARTDDRKHPHYCEFTARAKVRDFDGTEREAIGTKTVDLREDDGNGTPGKDYSAIVNQAKRNQDPKKRDPSRRIEGERQFIAEKCASKAMNRAISSVLAIPRSYKPTDLKKPFIVPKLVLDSRHPLAGKAIIAGMAGAKDALFGAQPQGQIIDADYEPAESARDEALTQAGGEEPDRGPPGAPSGSNSEPEPTGTQQVIEVITVAWGMAKHGKMSADAFRSLCETQTGCKRKEDMTMAQAETVITAVDAYLANSDDEMPV